MGFSSFYKHFLEKCKIGKGNLHLTGNRLSWNEICCASDNPNFMSHTCKRIFKFELQLSSYWQTIKFSQFCPKFHIFTKIIIFQVYLQLFRPTASSLEIVWQGHVRNTLLDFCQLWAVKCIKAWGLLIHGNLSYLCDNVDLLRCQYVIKPLTMSISLFHKLFIQYPLLKKIIIIS